MNLLNKIEKWELHHKITAFVAIMVGTIVFTRIAVLVHNPNPVFLHFELHHFDYGIFLLFVTCLLLLFSRRNSPLYLLLAAVAFGLIIDELWFIRSNVNESEIGQISSYNSTFLSVLVIAKVIVFTILLIDHFKNRKRKGGI